MAVAHVSHWFAGLVVLGAKQTPPITQPLHVVWHMFVPVLQTWPAPQVDAPGSQRSVDSLQVSVPLQVTASAQTRAAPVPQTASAEHVSPTLQKRPSSQVAPVLGDHAVVEVAIAHVRHWLAGLVVLGA